MSKLFSRLKKAFNHETTKEDIINCSDNLSQPLESLPAEKKYETKEAVVDYAKSLSNPSDLLSGDLVILRNTKEENLTYLYDHMMESTQKAVKNNQENAAVKRDDYDMASDSLYNFYNALKEHVKTYSPETFVNIDDSHLIERQSRYILNEKEAIEAYFDSLEDTDNLLSGQIGRTIHWQDHQDIFRTYSKYLELDKSYHQTGAFKSMEQRAKESEDLAFAEIECYDLIRKQLDKHHPEFAILYVENISPMVFDITSEALKMKDYIETLRDENDITSGSQYYLPEFIKPYRKQVGNLSQKGENVSDGEKTPYSVYKDILNDAYKHYKSIDADIVKEYENISSQKKINRIKDYLDSLENPNDFLSGHMEQLPHDLYEKYEDLWCLEEDYYTEQRFYHPDEREPYENALKNARKEFYTNVKEACEAYLNNQEINHQQNSDMKRKKTKKSEPKEEKEPLLVTVNGDKITHAHAFKSNKSEDWFYTARINGVQMNAQIMDKNDVEKVLDKTVTTKEMMEKYYPATLLPKVNVAEFKLPRAIATVNGEEQILKFNVYKETDPNNVSYGKYRFYAQVGDKRMSCDASKQDLDAYFNRVTTPVLLITKNFGDRLGIAAHYEQYKLPEGMNIEGKNIHLKKNQDTNRYEISVNVPDRFKTPAKELSYDDRQSYFQHKVASKEQLAAKYLSSELTSLSMTQKPQVEKQMSMSR